MCEHVFIIEDNFQVCCECGLVTGDMFISPEMRVYGKQSLELKKLYSRDERFARLFENLQGLRNVDYETVEMCKPHSKTIKSLRRQCLFNYIPGATAKVAAPAAAQVTA